MNLGTPGRKVSDVPAFFEDMSMSDIVIPTMFKRDPESKLVIPELADGCDWIFTSAKARLTMMLDGYCFKVEGERPYTLFKRQRILRDGVIETNWVPIDKDNAAHARWWAAFHEANPYRSGIYELIGPEIKGNPHKAKKDVLVGVIPASYNLCPNYGETSIRLMGTAESLYKQIKTELENSQCDVEGVVIQDEEWVGGKTVIHRLCRVKKRDFGIPWPPPPEEVKATVPATVIGNDDHPWMI